VLLESGPFHIVEAMPYPREASPTNATAARNWVRWFPEYDNPLGPPKGPASTDEYWYHREFKLAWSSSIPEKKSAEII
jgi:hypothetical protein